MSQGARAPALKVLVVDDDASIRGWIKGALGRRFGVDVLEARDGSEGLDLLLRYGVELAILDLRMPEMDGAKAIRAIRRSSRHRELPVIVITGLAQEEVVREVAALGVSAFLIKPFPIDRLFARVRESSPALAAAELARSAPTTLSASSAAQNRSLL